jgi:tyrosyl-tRNA synthetase
MIKQGAVRIDGGRVEDPGLKIAKGDAHVFQVGKRRFAQVKVI